VQVEITETIDAARLRVLSFLSGRRLQSGVRLTVVVRTTPTQDSTTVANNLAAMTPATLAPVASALAEATGQAPSAFTIGYAPARSVSCRSTPYNLLCVETSTSRAPLVRTACCAAW